MLTPFLHSEVTWNTRTVFQRYHTDLIMVDAMKNPHRLSIFNRILKSDMLEGAFQMGISESESNSESESRGIYEYRIILENIRQYYLGTD